jgi:hypothetical protein
MTDMARTQGSGNCPQFVVNQSFNAVGVLPNPIFRNAAEQFVDYARGDFNDAP